MKKIFWLLVLTLGGNRLFAQTVVGFNFSGGAVPVSGWINVSGDPSVAVRTATDPVSHISISSVLTTNWSPNGDACYADGQGSYGSTFFFPQLVMGFMWINQGTQAEFNAAVPQLEISGLSPDSVYYVRMTGSYLYGADGDPTTYTVAGLTMQPAQSLNIGGNTSSGITFQQVKPDANGKIRVYVNTNGSSVFAGISGVQIISGSATVAMPTVHITSPRNNDVLAEESNIVINATATETGSSITKVEFFHDTVKIGEVATAPYSITWNNPDEGHYLITAKATDAAGTTNTASINISVESLTSFWSMTGNIAMNADSNFVGNVDSVRLAFRTKNIERMSISPLGNVGIGTINPTAQLHTTGTVRLAGLKNDSTSIQPRMLVSDTSGNLYYRSLSGGALSPGDGLGQTSTGISLGDSIPGPGPHSFNSNRYQYLNGHLYSIGGSVFDPVNHPAFRIYNNGDLSAGTTMDTTVNTKYQAGLRYFGKTGYLAVGGTDRIDTTKNPIVYGPYNSSGLIINTDEPNTIKGQMMNTVFTSNSSTLDSGSRTENAYISGEQLHLAGAGNTFIRSYICGFNETISASILDCIIAGQANTISKFMIGDVVSGILHVQQDTSFVSIIGGARVKYGGFGQLAVGQYLTNRTPFGTTLGNANVDFATLPFTGAQGANVANIGSYPLFALGNSSFAGNFTAFASASNHSNALTVLYNGRTQINTTGFTNNLAQADVTPKAALDVVSTTTGVLLPRLTNTQRNAIVSGDLQNGLLLYNTDSSVFQYYNGSAWSSVGSGSGGSGRWQFASGTQYDTINSIGIGTSAIPSGYKLAVNGNAIFTKIKVKAVNTWADYVFANDYHLPTLPELERYVGEHHHLPGIASEQQVRDNGLDIGDHQAALLKNVEELTLYLIAENKRLTEQARRMDDQEACLEKQQRLINDQNARLDAQQKQIDELKALILEKNKQH
jgi:hypothetical protein